MVRIPGPVGPVEPQAPAEREEPVGLIPPALVVQAVPVELAAPAPVAPVALEEPGVPAALAAPAEQVELTRPARPTRRLTRW